LPIKKEKLSINFTELNEGKLVLECLLRPEELSAAKKYPSKVGKRVLLSPEKR